MKFPRSESAGYLISTAGLLGLVLSITIETSWILIPSVLFVCIGDEVRFRARQRERREELRWRSWNDRQ